MLQYSNFLKKHNLFNRDKCVDLYDGGIRTVDRYIGKMIEELKKKNLWNNLLLIVVSDHGEHFSEHHKGFFDYHGRDLFEEFIRIPFIVKYPSSMRRPSMHKIDTPVSLIDVTPTVLDFYNISAPQYVQGKSLLAADPKKRVIVTESLSGDVEGKLLRRGKFKYMAMMNQPSGRSRANWNGIFERRLFDLAQDPLEKNNLCRAKEKRAACLKHEAALRKIIEDSGREMKPQVKTTIEKQTVEQMKALGYIQ
jgi:arylsulfatase A-like enzyme